VVSAGAGGNATRAPSSAHGVCAATGIVAWQAAAPTKFARPKGEFKRDGEKALQLSEQFLVLITCRDEKQQVELLGRFQGEGLECKALVG